MRKTCLFLMFCFIFLIGLVVVVSADTITIRPSGSGDLCNIPLESGDACPDHYKNVDEETVSYADYVKCDAVNSWVTDLYTFNNMSTGFTVDNVTVFAVFKGDNGGFGQGKITLKSGGSFNNSSYVQPGDNYRTLSYKMENNPITSSNWTWSEVNNLQIGISLKGDPGGGPFFPSYAYCYQVYAVVNYSGTRLNCYNENNASNISCWTVEISNSDGSEVYLAECVNNTHNISINDMPSGSNTIFTFSSDGYETRSYVLDVSDVVNLDAYLAPIKNDDYIQYSSSAVTDPSSDVDITLDCVPDRVILVKGWNESYYGHWFNIPGTNWTLSGSTITVDSSMLDDNTTMVQAEYICSDNILDYIIHVMNSIGVTLEDATVEVKRLIDDDYETVVSGLTDGNGDVTVFLIPGQHYKIHISKTGYLTEVADWTPSENVRTKTYRLEWDDDDTNASHWMNDVDISAELSSSCTLYLNYTDASSGTSSVNVTVEIWNGSAYNSTVYYYNSSSNSFSDSSSVSCAFGYRVVFNVSHDTFGDFTHTIMLNYQNGSAADASDLEAMFETVLGDNPFGWINFIGIFVMLVGLFAFGEQGAGISLIGTGMAFLFLNVLIIGFVASTMIPILFVILGFLVEWRHHANG